MLADFEIYVIGKGFVQAGDLNIDDQVYTLDSFDVSIRPIDSLSSDFFSGKLNRIDCGNHNLLSTDETRHHYYSPNRGFKALSFSQIDQWAMFKKYDPRFFLPVLSWASNPEERNIDWHELEYVARAIAINRGDPDSLLKTLRRTGVGDCILLVDLLEHWCSQSPGDGWFGRAQVKTRSHKFRDLRLAEEMSVVAARAGYTAAISGTERYHYLRVNYESMPVPGSRPKNEKYYSQYYTGMVYTVGAGNLPILGRSNFGRVFYLPCGNGKTL